jgi:hypothetical protein
LHQIWKMKKDKNYSAMKIEHSQASCLSISLSLWSCGHCWCCVSVFKDMCVRHGRVWMWMCWTRKWVCGCGVWVHANVGGTWVTTMCVGVDLSVCMCACWIQCRHVKMQHNAMRTMGVAKSNSRLELHVRPSSLLWSQLSDC